MRYLFAWCVLLFPVFSYAEGETTSTGSSFVFPFEWILEKINAVITVVSDFIKAVWTAIINFFAAFIDTLLDMLKDFFFWIFETVLTFAFSLFDTIFAGLSSFNVSNYVNALPPDITNILGLIGIGECFALIGSALLIRITLQLIPFTRLGS